jgi:hypothetical protein
MYGCPGLKQTYSNDWVEPFTLTIRLHISEMGMIPSHILSNKLDKVLVLNS